MFDGLDGSFLAVAIWGMRAVAVISRARAWARFRTFFFWAAFKVGTVVTSPASSSLNSSSLRSSSGSWWALCSSRLLWLLLLHHHLHVFALPNSCVKGEPKDGISPAPLESCANCDHFRKNYDDGGEVHLKEKAKHHLYIRWFQIAIRNKTDGFWWFWWLMYNLSD